MKTVSIVTAAGAGVRMGSGTAKQFMDLDGKPLLAVTLENFEQCALVESVVLVVPQDKVLHCKREIVGRFGYRKVDHVVPGGRRRQDSVRLGLEAVREPCEIVLIHDGVRPFAPPDFISRIVTAAFKHRAVVPALPVKETIKRVDAESLVVETPERDAFRLIQTPQAFRYEDILRAHRRAWENNWKESTDDALLLERSGIPVTVIEGLEENIKITAPYDLELAKFILRGKNLHHEGTKRRKRES